MRITCRWIDETGKNGKMPGRFATVQEAEDAARKFMAKHPTITSVGVPHETTGTVARVGRPTN